MKNKLSVTALIVVLLLAILWAARQFSFIDFIRRLHGG